MFLLVPPGVAGLPRIPTPLAMVVVALCVHAAPPAVVLQLHVAVLRRLVVLVSVRLMVELSEELE